MFILYIIVHTFGVLRKVAHSHDSMDYRYKYRYQSWCWEGRVLADSLNDSRETIENSLKKN